MEYDRRQTPAVEADDQDAQTVEDVYHQKVLELARRGITVQQLLEFYRFLKSPCSCMPKFAPDTHTTHDVVRHAIIPLTKASGEAYATADTPPTKFVTHNWGNRFRDLLAAVMSDALGEGEFFAVACLLDSNLAFLENLLKKRGALKQSYWICCFCVRQHLSICDQPGAAYQRCDCALPKALNDTPPLTKDGRSIPCEMNKFQDMIEYMAASSSFGGQVVAVDRDFTIFERCWCVAEVAEAHRLGLRQELKVQSRRLLMEKQRQLKALKIEEMKGSRPDDIVEILKKIPNKLAFNQYLQDIFFNEHWGLISQWKAPDSTSVLKDIARISKMLAACALRSERGCWMLRRAKLEESETDSEDVDPVSP